MHQESGYCIGILLSVCIKKSINTFRNTCRLFDQHICESAIDFMTTVCNLVKERWLRWSTISDLRMCLIDLIPSYWILVLQTKLLQKIGWNKYMFLMRRKHKLYIDESACHLDSSNAKRGGWTLTIFMNGGLPALAYVSSKHCKQ